MKLSKELVLLITALLISSSALLAFQKEIRGLDTFTKISLKTSANVYLKQGDIQKVELTGNSDDFNKMEIVSKDGKLIIDYNSKISRKERKRLGNIKVHVTVKNIEALAVAGSGDMMSKERFEVRDLEISVAGSGDLDFEASAKDITIKIAGSGNVLLRGSSHKNQVAVAGSGKLNAEDMETEAYKISVAGSGICRIHAKEEIKSKISGSGSVYYKGDPKRINNKSSGSGKIRKI